MSSSSGTRLTIALPSNSAAKRSARRVWISFSAGCSRIRSAAPSSPVPAPSEMARMCAASIEPASSLARAASPARAQPSATPARSQVRRARPVSASSRSPAPTDPAATASAARTSPSSSSLAWAVSAASRMARWAAPVSPSARSAAPTRPRQIACSLAQSIDRATSSRRVSAAPSPPATSTTVPKMGTNSSNFQNSLASSSIAAARMGRVAAGGSVAPRPRTTAARPSARCSSRHARPARARASSGAPHCASTRNACAGTTLAEAAALAPMRQRRTSVAASPAAPSSASVRSWMNPAAAPTLSRWRSSQARSMSAMAEAGSCSA